jgi:hypothetical protein
MTGCRFEARPVANSILLMVKNRLRSNLHELKYEISEEDALRLARFLLDDLDASRWRVVPADPTKEMVDASLAAMHNSRRREAWVKPRQKHKWRLAAGIEASPDWKLGRRPTDPLPQKMEPVPQIPGSDVASETGGGVTPAGSRAASSGASGQ